MFVIKVLNICFLMNNCYVFSKLNLKFKYSILIFMLIVNKNSEKVNL